MRFIPTENTSIIEKKNSSGGHNDRGRFNTWIQIIDDNNDDGANTPGNAVVGKAPPLENQLVHDPLH